SLAPPPFHLSRSQPCDAVTILAVTTVLDVTFLILTIFVELGERLSLPARSTCSYSFIHLITLHLTSGVATLWARCTAFYTDYTAAAVRALLSICYSVLDRGCN